MQMNSKNTDMNFRIVFIIFLIFTFLTGAIAAQELSDDLKIRKSEFKTDVEEGFQEAWNNVKQGNQFYEPARERLHLQGNITLRLISTTAITTY